MKKLHSYKNGNYTVDIYEDGTKVRETEDVDFIAQFPESLDVKITNYCDMGCAYCHENSTKAGKHSDIIVLMEQLSLLPAGIELAVGGGNPLDHPDLHAFLIEANKQGFIVNMTVNQGHVNKFRTELEYYINNDLIKGIGVSVTQPSIENIKWLTDLTPHVVYHIIAGINSVSILGQIKEQAKSPKVLVLGYKTFGRGIDYINPDVELGIKEWETELPKQLGTMVISFDNLAIEQLEVQEMLPSKLWDEFYMGDDFTHTMYVDAVNQEFAPTSRSKDRINFKDSNLLDFFTQYRGILAV